MSASERWFANTAIREASAWKPPFVLRASRITAAEVRRPGSDQQTGTRDVRVRSFDVVSVSYSAPAADLVPVPRFENQLAAVLIRERQIKNANHSPLCVASGAQMATVAPCGLEVPNRLTPNRSGDHATYSKRSTGL